MHERRADALLTTPTTGLEVHYRDWGDPMERADGPDALPPVLLLHGLASTCRIYDLCASLLVQDRRVVADDQRGHGESGKPEGGYDLDTLVTDGRGVVQALGLSAPYVVVEHSWGASVALRWTVSRPADVHAAVLVDGGVSSFRDLPGATWRTVEDRFGPPEWRNVHFEDLLAHTRQGDLAALDESFRRAFFAALTMEQADGTVRACLSAANHWRILRALWEDDLDVTYHDVRRPTLGLHASPFVAVTHPSCLRGKKIDHNRPRPCLRCILEPLKSCQGTSNGYVTDQLARRGPTLGLLALPAEPWDDARRAMVESKRHAAVRREALRLLLRVRWLEDTIHDIPLQRPVALAEAIEGV